MNREMNRLLESLAARLMEAEAFDAEEMLLAAAKEVGEKYAKTRFIAGTPEVQSKGGITVLKGQLQPYNDAKLDSFTVVLDGADVKISASALVAGEDAESQGFQHKMAKQTYPLEGLTAPKLAKLIVGLAKKVK